MSGRLDAAVSILRDLIAFPTVSTEPNVELIDYASRLLEAHGARLTMRDELGDGKANLFATLGPEGDGGLVLAAHTDVVPTEGQEWTVEPFAGIVRDDRVWGRGAADMKGFIACVLAMLPELSAWPLARPLHIALTCNEEVGCQGARSLLSKLAEVGPHPGTALIGEPTELRIVDGHKGCFEYTTEILGLEGHASMPHQAVSSIHAAVRFIACLSELQEELRAMADPSSGFDPPYTTINVGTFHGGVARNIAAGHTTFDWEIRSVRAGDVDFVWSRVDRFVSTELLPEMRAIHPDADVVTTTVGAVGQLEPDPRSPALELARRLVGSTERSVVSFGTEAGVYQEMGIPAVVCGPGSIEQAHKPDEHIALSQLAACIETLEGLQGELT